MRFLLTYLMLAGWFFTAVGQQDIQLSKNFLFKDGIYLDLQAWQSNHPSLRWDEVEAVYFINPQTHLAQIQRIRVKENGDTLNLSSIWAICSDGIPYVKIPHEEINRELASFAALQVRGKICYFSYPDWRNKKYEIAAYNPLNGRPFRKGTVDREEEFVLEKMLDFETGRLADFTVDNFLDWIQDDPRLVATVNSLDENEQKEKLFKCLLIYVDRNPVSLKKQ